MSINEFEEVINHYNPIVIEALTKRMYKNIYGIEIF